MRNPVLLSIITFTIACQEQPTSELTSEPTQQRVEIEPNLTKMSDAFQQYVDRQVNDFAFTQNKLSEVQPDGPECLFGGEVQGQIDMAQAVPAWHIDLLDDNAIQLDTVELFSTAPEPTVPTLDWELSEETDGLSLSSDPIIEIELSEAPVDTDDSSKEISLRPERVTIEIDLARPAENAQLSGEWYICVGYAQ